MVFVSPRPNQLCRASPPQQRHVGQCGQRRCFVDSGPGCVCVASPTRTAIKGETRRDLLWPGPSHPLLTRGSGCHSACAGVAMSRTRGSSKSKDTNHANRPSVPKNIMKAVTELLPLKHPVGNRHNKFLRHITLRELTVAGKCNKSG